MKIDEMSSSYLYSTNASLENHSPDSSNSENRFQSDITNSWSSIPNPFSNSIWSPSATVSGTWRLNPSSCCGGWDSFRVNLKNDIENTIDDKEREDKEDVPPSLVESMSQMNLVTNRPFLPSCLDSPKNALTMWYGQRFKNSLQFKANECFTTWGDGGKPHEVLYTSIFTCPVTGEHFASGKYGKERDVFLVRKDEDVHVDVFWFYKKRHAEHAAAARALDCLSFREGKGVRTMAYGLCDEEPYLRDDVPPLPISSPTLLLQSKAELLVKEHRIVTDMDLNSDEIDRIEDRDAYRQSRVSSMLDTENS